MSGDLLKRAAEFLEDAAHSLKEAHTLANGEWHITTTVDARAKREYDETLRTARELREFAQSLVEGK